MPTSATETVPLTDLTPLERNPRRHPERQIDELVRSLQAFGQYRDLVIDEEGTILAGNGLFQAMRQAGMSQANVRRYTGLTDAQKTKLILADNRTADLGMEHMEIVDELIRELDGDFDIPGFDPGVLEELMAEAEDLLPAAQQYGQLSPDAIASLNRNSARVEDADAQAIVGSPPPPPTPHSAAQAAAEAAEAAGPGAVCPTCSRPW